MQILLKFIVNKDFLSGLENELECHSAFIDQEWHPFPSTYCTNLVALRHNSSTVHLKINLGKSVLASVAEPRCSCLLPRMKG